MPKSHTVRGVKKALGRLDKASKKLSKARKIDNTYGTKDISNRKDLAKGRYRTKADQKKLRKEVSKDATRDAKDRSAAAKKGWETRRKKSGSTGMGKDGALRLGTRNVTIDIKR